MRYVSMFLAAALSALMSITAASATTMQALSMQEHVAQSAVIVRARVMSQRGQWNEDHTNIVTLTTLRVSSYLKGQGEQEIVVRQLGGQVEQTRSELAGSAHLTQGEEAIVFLRSGPGVYYFTAMSQSVFHIHGQRAERDFDGANFVGNSNMALKRTMPVRALIAQIRSAVRGAQ